MNKIVVETKCYPKVNIFLKIAQKRGSYHEIVSRFVKVYSIYDTFTIIKSNNAQFVLQGEFGCNLEQNTIYKAYMILKDLYPQVEEFYKNHMIIVEKRVPYFAGLGGGSSNCATFLLLTNRLCKLNISKDELASIGLKIGADVPFFVYEYDSANVTGIGENVKEFLEDKIDLKIFTPDVKCDTAKIFSIFRKHFYKEIKSDDAIKLLETPSINILKTMTISQANDLYNPVKYLYDNMTLSNFKLDNKKTFFSGSGSSFFSIM